MKKFMMVACMVALVFGVAANVQALDITTWDGNGTGIGWYGDGEDNEVEPGMVAAQEWDLEAFLLNGTELTMIGGYDFKNGYGGYDPGDIFIDIDGGALFGDIHEGANGNDTVDNKYGYEYAIRLDFSNNTYDVYEINSGSKVTTAFYQQNQGSSPWRYDSGAVSSSEEAGTFSYTAGASNKVILDLSFLGAAINNFTVHYTMECGNDNLMGKYDPAPVPEPSTVLADWSRPGWNCRNQP